MEQDTPLIVELAPSVIAAIALISAGLLTYFLTTRLEHRKWLREQRVEAYEGYVATLRKMQRVAELRTTQQSELDELTRRIDRLRLVGTLEANEVAQSHAEQMKGKLEDTALIQSIVRKSVTEFYKQARKDLGIQRRVR
jgi:hypothetical protein